MSQTEKNIKFLDDLLNQHPVIKFPKEKSVYEYIGREKKFLKPATKMINFCTQIQQVFINELIRGYSEVNDRKINYMEIGLYYGASLVAAMANNFDCFNKIVANDFFEWHDNSIDKFSEHFLKFLKKTTGEQYNFENNDFLYKITKDIDLTLVKGDCWKKRDDILSIWGDEKVDIYYYDGDHCHKAQKDAVIEYITCYADEFIYMADDYTNVDVQNGTREGIEHLTNNGYELLYEINTMDRWEGHIHTKDGWGDGWYIGYLKKI
tara:strand:+ start:969 stop:1760 length:792 start_codon:yes stop_codon:yes gene_type:complete